MTAWMLLLALVGCKKGVEQDSAVPTQPVEDAYYDVQDFKIETDASGLATLTFEVEEGHTAVLVTASSKDSFVGVNALVNPDGHYTLDVDDWWYNEKALTDAFFASTYTTALNWPIRGMDPPLTPGVWSVEYYAASMMGQYQSTKLTGKVHLKRDNDLAFGTTHVRVVYAKDTDKPKVKNGMEIALQRWTEIWAARGLTLDAQEVSSELDKDLGFAWDSIGSKDIEDLASTFPEGTLVLVVGETIDNDMDLYGLAGGIPGAIHDTPMTWVLVSWLTHAGADGIFVEDEARMFGETMAHEIGHYTGLFHPVECGLDCGQNWDALMDTPDCVGWQDCEEDLASNLMFPYPVCGMSDCTPAGDLTRDQEEVVQQYLGTQ